MDDLSIFFPSKGDSIRDARGSALKRDTRADKCVFVFTGTSDVCWCYYEEGDIYKIVYLNTQWT